MIEIERAAGPIETDDKNDGRWTGLIAVVGLLVALALWSPIVFVMVVAILFFIFMHEVGHFVTARWTGMKATEFFIGFGPRIFSFRRGETEFGLKPILVGAYVKIVGMNDLEEVDPADEPRTYRQATFPRKALVITAGSMMHFVMAIVLFFGYFAFIGEPNIVDETAWTVTTPTVDSAAESAGLVAGDSIIGIDGVPIHDFDDLRETVEARAGKSVDIVIVREGVESTLSADIGTNPSDSSKGFLGVGREYEIVRATQSIPAAAGHAVTELPARAWDSISGLGMFVTDFGGYLDNVFTAPGNQDQIDFETRPISVIGVADVSRQIGAEAVYLLAFFNVFIGVFNLLPLLPLDGGHLAIAIYERVRSRNGERYVADINKLLPITYAVFLMMVVFGLGAIWLDIANPIRL
ncbi:MAG: PDZ domain-containing protein [Actinomycetia bacterium]|nr:PDZ domain-containing protein [Actinomycetes bacterium]MCP4962514.1 PDZ domain-containing protein [Actinomycetes bacterium]